MDINIQNISKKTSETLWSGDIQGWVNDVVIFSMSLLNLKPIYYYPLLSALEKTNPSKIGRVNQIILLKMVDK